MCQPECIVCHHVVLCCTISIHSSHSHLIFFRMQSYFLISSRINFFLRSPFFSRVCVSILFAFLYSHLHFFMPSSSYFRSIYHFRGKEYPFVCLSCVRWPLNVVSLVCSCKHLEKLSQTHIRNKGVIELIGFVEMRVWNNVMAVTVLPHGTQQRLLIHPSALRFCELSRTRAYCHIYFAFAACPTLMNNSKGKVR